ncbi:MAG TPA: bifunctional DNA-binding transcriptional regulator/O6-methylguanine-DNA methyltransferase Ada [Terriglobia bacterium]|nr:bifunctional DNA-binding transcriptional regulator/O6-methylguanine-DNA methyltransferase Ada [Terriglobia bacterium]
MMAILSEAKSAVRAGTRPDDRYWQAVLDHDHSYDGSFVYAVRSTGIYCRPSCPSRRPRKNQVVFYPHSRAAEQAGFRPCRRCGAQAGAAGDRQLKLVGNAIGVLDAAADEAPTLTELGAQLGLSPHRLARGFKRATGLTPREYAEARRLGRLRTSLRTSENVAAAVYEAGYGSSRAVYERARAQLGMTPGAYRRGGAGMRIGYTIVDSPLGRLLIAATGLGVCRVCLGDSDAPLRKSLSDEYPKAEIRPDPAGLQNLVNAFQNHLSGEAPALNLPVDVQATTFQWKVWRELRNIPYGETRSYTEVARAVGRPRAARAVARACAVNPVALVVPCHRVLRQDRSLGGYRWGLERKRTLLQREQRQGAR